MAYLVFELKGDMAMWRNPYESMGAFSCLGPSPSNIAGIIGAALGFASPKSQGAVNPDEKKLKALDKKGLPWPVSPELLLWQEENDFHVACRWIGDFPQRSPWNVNGCKDLDPVKGNLRIQQQVIENPSYEVSIRLSQNEAGKVSQALREPAFPLFLGASFCRAIVKNISIQEDEPQRENWAYWKNGFVVGNATPFSRHIINAEEVGERIKSEGFWVYPTKEYPAEQGYDAFVKGYCALEVNNK
ncbi:MAG: CRISPR-associated protein Cas5 [Lentisphaeraceae bacterium]|nr:CRISPR-associated protein Cas5 [Lentisphaeraceae bacterium]